MAWDRDWDRDWDLVVEKRDRQGEGGARGGGAGSRAESRFRGGGGLNSLVEGGGVRWHQGSCAQRYPIARPQKPRFEKTD